MIDELRLLARKHQLISQMFFERADETYIAARWSFFAGLPHVFCWNTMHCIEKYLKSCLLINEVTVIKSGHRINELVLQFDQFVEPISKKIIEIPEVIVKYSSRETIYDFIDRFSYLGHASNRYNEIGVSLFGDELQKLDRIVYTLRGWFAPLARPRFENNADRNELPDWTWRE